MKLEKKLIVLSAVGFLALLLTYQFGFARALYPGVLDYINHAPNEAVVAFYGSVALAASFTDWTPRYQLQEISQGVWSVLVPLAPGVHEYSFVVDGERWVADPLAPSVDDGFGGVNSQLAILPSSQSL